MYEVHKLLTSLGLIEGSAEVAGGGYAVLLLYATHLHAHVASLYHYHDSSGVEGLFDSLLDLQRHTFLHLQAMAVYVYHAGYFR